MLYFALATFDTKVWIGVRGLEWDIKEQTGLLAQKHQFKLLKAINGILY